MTADVSRVQGAYKIQSSNGSDIFVVDTTNGDFVIPSNPTTSRVVITGNLVVVGTQTITSSTFIVSTNPTILLNHGDTFLPAIGGASVSGLQISRDSSDTVNTSAFLQWNEGATWTATGNLSAAQTGLFEFRKGPTSYSSGVYSAIKINAIRMPSSSGAEGTWPSIGTTHQRLNIFGSDNPTAVISVSGTTNYETNVTDKDDIPNKRYVDNAVATGVTSTNNIVDGLSYITIIDQQLNTSTSQIVGVLNGAPVDTAGVIANNATGTIVLRITTSTVQFTGIQFIQNKIQPVGINANLNLTTTGTGQIVFQSPVLIASTVTSVPSPGQTGLYANSAGKGGTGVYFVNSATTGTVTSGELISLKKAVVFGLIL